MNVKSNHPIKIAVVGPESTGKSTMSHFLAREYQTISVPEYARYYCKDLQNKYTLQDELNMFHGQIALEDAILDSVAHDIIIFDTTILTVKIWSDHLFKHTAEVVLTEIRKREYDFYLLMNIDLPWEHDPLRDFPNDRTYFMQVWEEELKAVGANYSIISNLGDARLQEGKQKCDTFIQDYLSHSPK